MCCRCGQLIDRTLRYPHPMSVSLEHLIALNDGGVTELWNLGVSHLVENTTDGGHISARRVGKLKTSREW